MKKLFLVIIFFFTFSFISFSQNPGDATFSSPDIHTIKFYFSQTSWWDSLISYYPADKKMLGSVDIDDTYIDSVGIQFKGNTSFNKDSLKNPFKIDFNEFVAGQKYDGLKVINLNNGTCDPTFMREKVFLDFCHTAGIEAPRATYANLYINDTLWGLYILVEQVNKTFLQSTYGNDGGNLFKGEPHGTLEWLGSTPANYYHNYELKTNETANDWTDLVHLIDKINNTPSVNFYDSLESVLNTSAYIEAWAVNNIFSNLDSYMGSGHNYYIYHNTVTDKFDFIIWDVNGSFGANKQIGLIPEIESMTMLHLPPPPNYRPLNDKMLQNTVYTSAYINTICNYVSNYFSNTYFDPLIDSLANRIRPYVYADTNKFYSNQLFENNIITNVNTGNYKIPGLKSFITNRRNSLLSELATYGCNMNVNYISRDANLKNFPNPTPNYLTIENPCPIRKTFTLSLSNIQGQLLLSEQVEIDKTHTIDLSKFPNGIYFLTLQNEKENFVGKVVVQR